MVKYCKKCVMSDQRPGITFNEAGVCQGCITAEKKTTTDWDARLKELEALCAQYRGKGMFDCIIAVSSGKDSWYQVHVMKELMHMNPLLVTVEDNFPSTEAGKHNMAALSEVFSCPILSLKPNIAVQKKVMRYTFEKYGTPTWYIDRLIYTYPLWVASKFNIPLLIYGENVSYEYGGKDAVETFSALEQIKNGVANEIKWGELFKLGVSVEDQALLDPPLDYLRLKPIYLSYFTNWNAHEHYLFAKSRGFWDLDVKDHWHRQGVADNYSQIDSRAYLIHPQMKYVKYGHSWGMTDLLSRQIRYGLITRDAAIQKMKASKTIFDPQCVRDFCAFLGYSNEEFWTIIDKFYNPDLFTPEHDLRHPIWEASP
jgi:N-acetyl sugar amidotransferase